MRVTLDASVFVSAYLASDVHHAISIKLLWTLIEYKIDLNAPIVVLAEVAAALARNTRGTERGLAAEEMIEQTPRLKLYPLSLPLGKKAAEFASTNRAAILLMVYRRVPELGPPDAVPPGERVGGLRRKQRG